MYTPVAVQLSAVASLRWKFYGRTEYQEIETIIICAIHLSKDQPEDDPTNRAETCHCN